MKGLIRFAAALVSLIAVPAFAQNLPVKPVHTFSGFATDLVDRIARVIKAAGIKAW